MKKNIIVTGATSGIGKDLVKLLSKNRYGVLATGRNEAALAELKKYNSNIICKKCDVSDINQVQEMIEYAITNFKNIDVLINNAGIGIFDSIVDSKIEDWHTMIDTNIKGLLNVIHSALPYLINTKGHIINMGSVASHHIYSNTGVYCATKHAVFAISESLRIELSKKIKVTTISPGSVNTPFLEKTKNETLSNQFKQSFKNGMESEWVANQIIYTIETPSNVNISEIIIRPV